MSVLCNNLEVLVGQRGVVYPRDDRRGQVLCPFDAVERGIGLERNAANLGIQFFQPACRPDEGSGGAEHGDEVGDAAFGLLPDFVRCAFVMRAPVGVIRILICIKIQIGMALGELPRNFDGSVRTFGRIGIDDICAVCL